MGRRFQARVPSGRFTRNTMENTFGLHCDVCSGCRGFLTYGVNELPPAACPRCGEIQVRERCAHGRCMGIEDPKILWRGGYPECGKPAVAVDLQRRWGWCDEHVDTSSTP